MINKNFIQDMFPEVDVDKLLHKVDPSKIKFGIVMVAPDQYQLRGIHPLFGKFYVNYSYLVKHKKFEAKRLVRVVNDWDGPFTIRSAPQVFNLADAKAVYALALAEYF